MPSSSTKTLSFKDIVTNAHGGTYKLPAFQRKWKWTKHQVISLYHSLRMGYPIGAILTLSSEDKSKLNPRGFHGVSKKAESNPTTNALVLDGQQRITAGIAIYYGIEADRGTEYYINVEAIQKEAKKRKLNVEDKEAVKAFSQEIDIDDGYIRAKPKKNDRASHFEKDRLIWTAYLTQDREAEYNDLLDKLPAKEKELKNFIRKVVKPYFSPALGHQVPEIEMPEGFDLAAVSRVFTTINTSGKLLTPFELVVAILFPDNINLEEDIEQFKAQYTYYNNMDKNGEILLQTVAMLDDKNPKKADLPKNITSKNYGTLANDAAEALDNLGKFLTNSLGVGLDVTGKYIPYDAVLAPMALAYSFVQSNVKKSEQGKAQEKLKRWFVGSTLSQRYQEGVHSKQAGDLEDFIKWVKEDNPPSWIDDVIVPSSIRSARPAGALGKLFVCLLNRQSPEDPILGERIGYFDGGKSSQDHHIFATRWAPNLKDYDKEQDSVDYALNIMIVATTTNSLWTNFSPKDQVNSAVNASQLPATRSRYAKQLIDDKGFELIRKDNLSITDFQSFLQNRFECLAKLIKDDFQFKAASGDSADEESIDIEEPVE